MRTNAYEFYLLVPFVAIFVFICVLNFSDEVDAGLEGFGSRFPIGRADLPAVFANENRRFELAQEFSGTAPDIVGVDLIGLQGAIRVDEETAAAREASVLPFLYVDAEISGQVARRVGHHRVGDFFDSRRMVAPGFVREFRIGADREHLGIQFLELRIVSGHLFQFGRTDEGEVCRIEEKDDPLAFEVGKVRCAELFFMVDIECKIRDTLPDSYSLRSSATASAACILIHIFVW